jgi:hypothetical protein
VLVQCSLLRWGVESMAVLLWLVNMMMMMMMMSSSSRLLPQPCGMGSGLGYLCVGSHEHEQTPASSQHASYVSV